MNSKNLSLYIVIGVLVLILLGMLALWQPWASPVDLSASYPNLGASTTTDSSSTASPAARTAQAAYTTTRVREGNHFVTTITLTDKGFSPAIVEVDRGDVVRFVNKTSLTMRISSNNYGTQPIYPSLSQDKSVGYNGTYELTFPEAGLWAYHNLNDETVTGIVYVR